MNATKRSVARVGLVLCSALAIAATGCRTYVVHSPPRTVYVSAPPPVVYVPPAPAPQPPPPVVIPPPPEQPPLVVIQSENDFYEPLTPYGRWVVVGSYGRCWIPARVEVGWRPYANGYWQRTDAGWYWASEEPWGWATYHYGRWDWHAAHGWIWMPHTQWAPAWVSWREGGGYVGWAPLRPSARIGVSVGVEVHEPAYASRAFVFVEHRRMLEPVRPKTVIVNNTTIINQTVNITNVKVVNKTVINEGPRPEVIERESGRKVQAVPAHEFRRREEATVAVRQRNIPAAPERKVQPSVRAEPQQAPKQAVLPRDARVVEKPAAVLTQPARPLAAPTRPTPSQMEPGRPARDANQRDAEAARKITTTPSRVEPQPRPEVKPAPAVPPRREVRPVEQPAATARPAPPTVTPNPIRDERKRDATIERPNTVTPRAVQPNARPEVKPAPVVPPRREVRQVEQPAATVKPAPQPVTTNPVRRDTAVEKKTTATPPAVQPKARPEVRPATDRAPKPPVRTETAPPASVRQQPAPPAEQPAEKKLMSPKEEAGAAERGDANMRKKEDKNPRKRGEEVESPSPAGRRPQPR